MNTSAEGEGLKLYPLILLFNEANIIKCLKNLDKVTSCISEIFSEFLKYFIVNNIK